MVIIIRQYVKISQKFVKGTKKPTKASQTSLADSCYKLSSPFIERASVNRRKPKSNTFYSVRYMIQVVRNLSLQGIVT